MSRRWDRYVILVVTYGLLCLGWLAFAWGIVPDLLDASYHGHGPESLNQLLARTSRRPFEHYLGLWHAFAWAVLLATGMHATLVAVIWSCRLKRGLTAFLVVTTTLFLGLSVLSGPRQDYPAYLEIWAMIRQGGDPWWVLPSRGYPLNAYGPLFVLFAPLAGANPLAPKLVFGLAYLLFVINLAAQVSAEPRLAGWSRWAWLALLIHPSFWIHIGWYGHFDILVALACLAAVRDRERGRDVAAGVWLGLGFLLKILPATLGPFLAFDRRPSIPTSPVGHPLASGKKVESGNRTVAAGWYPSWPFILAAGAVMGAGMAAAVAIWGPAALRPFHFAAIRSSHLLSIFRFLRGAYSPLRILGVETNLDWLATPALLLALALTWVACWVWRCDLSTAALLAVLCVVLGYKVGFVQYQNVPLALAVFWWLRHPEAPRMSPRLGAALAGYTVWIAGFEIFNFAMGGIVAGNPSWAWFEDVPGLPTFGLGVWLVIELLRWARRQSTLATSRV